LFEPLRAYPLSVAVAPAHPFARLKSVPLEKIAAEPLIGLNRKNYPEYYPNLNRIFAPIGVKPRVVMECDSGSSLLVEVEAGRGIALSLSIFELVTGKRLLYRPVTGTTELVSIGIARATKGDVTPAGEKFCEILRKTLDGAITAKGKPGRSSENGRRRGKAKAITICYSNKNNRKGDRSQDRSELRG
jgi:DNA-binding transcriptional LysR family regulator